MRSVLHGGLTPPAPGCMRDTSRAICVSDSQGRMCLGRECEPYANYAYSTCKFDRNIAAFMNAPSTRAYSICRLDTFTTGGLRPPLLVGNASDARIRRIPTANSTGTSLRSGTRPAHMRIYLRTRYVHHGGLTPPAPGRRYNERPRENGDFRAAQTHVHKSGGRQPAVVREIRLRRHEGDCSEKPPTVCGPITVAIACSDTTGGLRPPLLMHGPVAFRLLLTLFGAYLFESDSCLRAGSGCCLRCSEVNQA
jgi:hypothetical protein